MGSVGEVKVELASFQAVGGTRKLEVFAVMQGAVNDGSCEFLVMHHLPPLSQRFVRGEQGGFALVIAMVYELKQDIGCPCAVTEIAHLINHKDVKLQVRLECCIAVWGNLENSQLHPEDNLFTGQRGCLTVTTVSTMVKTWCQDVGLKGNYGSHTLRKTWGYWQRTERGTAIPLLMEAFGHATQRQTLAYLRIQSDEIA